MSDRPLLLRSLELFADVPEELYLDPVSHSWPEGAAIIVQGEPARGFVFLVSGATEVTVDGQTINQRQPIEILGELALLEDKPHSATVVARAVSMTLEYSLEQSRRLLDNSAFARNLLRDVSRKLRQATIDRGPRYMQLNELLSSMRAHVNAAVADELMESGIDGRPRHIEATLLFVDIRGFTSRSATMPPSEIAEDLGSFLSRVVDIVHAHGGVVDKFIGDAVMAWWIDSGDAGHAPRAVAAALQVTGEAAGYSFGGAPITVGAGLESGIVFLGSIGNEGKRQHTALGSVVNTAARLQAKSEELGGFVVVGAGTYARLEQALQDQFGRNASVDLKGLDETMAWIHTAGEETS